LNNGIKNHALTNMQLHFRWSTGKEDEDSCIFVAIFSFEKDFQLANMTHVFGLPLHYIHCITYHIGNDNF